MLSSSCVMAAELMSSIEVLCSVMEDPAGSVRVSVASAAANVSDALQPQQQLLQQTMLPQLSRLAAGMSLPSSSTQV